MPELFRPNQVENARLELELPGKERKSPKRARAQKVPEEWREQTLITLHDLVQSKRSPVYVP